MNQNPNSFSNSTFSESRILFFCSSFKANVQIKSDIISTTRSSKNAKTRLHRKKNVKPRVHLSKISGRWTDEEHILFLEAIERYGNMWSKVKDYIKTRTCDQIRSHCQKYFDAIRKEKIEETMKNNPRAIFAIHKSYRIFNSIKISAQLLDLPNVPLILKNKPKNDDKLENMEANKNIENSIEMCEPNIEEIVPFTTENTEKIAGDETKNQNIIICPEIPNNEIMKLYENEEIENDVNKMCDKLDRDFDSMVQKIHTENQDIAFNREPLFHTKIKYDY